jgi:hypothetical protein
LYGHETWCLTPWEEHRLRGSENRVLRDILGQKKDKITEKQRRLHNEELIICTPGRGTWRILRRGEVQTGWGNQRKRAQLENLGINGRIILKWLFKSDGT